MSALTTDDSTLHCRICHLSREHPGVVLGPDGVCSLCKLEVGREMLDNFDYARRVYDEFARSGPNPRGAYDCLFLYSGGKDSTYMLDKFVGDGRRVLAYTFDVPFESTHAADNIALAREKIAATFIVDKDDDHLKAMMREVFNRMPTRPGKYLDEKLPCMSCRTFFVVRAILHAIRAQIPYIILCADPQQIVTMPSKARDIVKGVYDTFERQLTAELFGSEIEDALFAGEGELPKIVFPFIATQHTYDPEVIIRELRAKGLYRSSPLETHCTLFPLLNYYSFKHWDCMFYKLNASSAIRAARKNGQHDRSTFSIAFPATADILDIESRMKAIVFDIASGRGAPAEHEEALTQLFKELDASEDAARFVARSFLDLPKVAAEMGITLA